MSSTAPTTEWSSLIRHFEVAQREKNLKRPVIERRVRHLTAFATEIPTAPSETKREDIAGWILSSNLATHTQESMRDSFRAFFRWAVGSGRIEVDPMGPSRRAVRAQAVEHWEVEIRAWEKSLRGVGRTASTVRQLGTYLRQFARDHERLSPWELTVDDLLDWFGSKRWDKETRRGRRSALRSFYAWAKSTKRTKKNPAAKLPIMRADPGVPRPASDDDLTIALALAGPRERLALWIASDLGLRCAEVAQVHRGDLRCKDDKWSLIVRGKGNKERVVPVPESLAQAIHSYGDQFLFPGDINGHISAHYLGKKVNATLPRGVTMHMLRHRFATLAYDATRDTFTVQRLLGHASPDTTQRYVQIADDTLRHAVDAVHTHQGGIDRARVVLQRHREAV